MIDLPYTSIRIKNVRVKNHVLTGIEIELPNAPNLVLLRGDKGFVMCGYLNIDVCEKLGLVAAMVTGVKTVDDLLDAEIKAATSKAEELGITPGKKVYEIIDLI